MSKNTSISLGDHFNEFIGTRIEMGRYGSASEVVRAALRLLEEHEAKIEALQASLKEGMESGVSNRSTDDIFKAAQDRHESLDA
ncbi:type II toxin-antitoxin system ParD family antitoxin [Leucothrix sargassi]|nr:type II toxin-antitoxin system ParD family antitoxin [Leucothrix sargassi]